VAIINEDKILTSFGEDTININIGDEAINMTLDTSSNPIIELSIGDEINVDFRDENVSVLFNNPIIYNQYGLDPSRFLTKDNYDSNDNFIIDKAEALIVDVEAKEDISIFDIVGSNGYRAHSDDISFLDKILGLAIENKPAGFKVNVISKGMIKNTNWNFTPNTVLFLNGYELSHTPPSSGFLQKIGKAITNNVIFIDIEQAIKL